MQTQAEPNAEAPIARGANPISVVATYAGRGGAVSDGDIVRWLLETGRGIVRDAVLVDELCWRLIGAGVSLWRTTLHVGTLHPQILGFGARWRRDRNCTEIFKVAHGVERTDDFLKSPILRVIEKGATVRHRLTEGGASGRYPLLADLARQGGTDYYAKPLAFSEPRRRYSTVTWATDAPGGFTKRDIAILDGVTPALASLVEVRATRRIAATLLDTYLGRHVGPRILGGQIRRGEGQRMRAALLASDMRGFSHLSDTLPGEEVIDLLDDYFELVAQPVQERGGDVLKFVGDGVLAMFPAGDGADRVAASRALDSARESLARIERLNESRLKDGRTPIHAGFGLHIGDVIYGNVGASDRLDFTAIGPAVNLACRVEDLTKRLERPLLMSRAFATAYHRPLVSLGFQPVRGISEPEELFGLE